MTKKTVVEKAGAICREVLDPSKRGLRLTYPNAEMIELANYTRNILAILRGTRGRFRRLKEQGENTDIVKNLRWKVEHVSGKLEQYESHWFVRISKFFGGFNFTVKETK